MALVIPKIAVLDSSTLGKVARDYWSQERKARDKAKRFRGELLDRGVCIAFTLTHICELLGHGSPKIVQDRLGFLRSIQLIAWLRPYERQWFPAGIPDLLTRELHAVVHDKSRTWKEIIQKVRPDLWETGTGAEMFVKNDRLWSVIRNEGMIQQQKSRLAASLARTDPGGIRHTKLGDLQKLPRRKKEERSKFKQQLFNDQKRQLDQHGDKRLSERDGVAKDFADKALKDLQAIDAMEGDPVLNVNRYHGIPDELVNAKMTVAKIGELAVYGKQLKLFAEKLNPPVKVRMQDVPINTLPSYLIYRKLAASQKTADRVSGSDIGDSFIAPLTLYAEGVEVDKRTYHHLIKIRNSEPELAKLMGPFFRSSDYLDIPKNFDDK